MKNAFTMAEILLSLTIIGVVAAITLPSLMGNINERTWNTQRKALYARFSQAMALMPSLNGYGTLEENEDENGSKIIEDTAAETFVTEGLAKVLKINNICDSEHFEDCGLPKKITKLTANEGTIDFPKTMEELNPFMINASSFGLEYSQINTKAAAFETQNGESIAVYYNPKCQADMQESYYIISPKICANFIFDLNGNKGPNTVGKDIGFLTAVYPTDTVVATAELYPQNKENLSWQQAVEYCRSLNGEYRLPSREELTSLYVNKSIIGNILEGNVPSNKLLLGNSKMVYYIWITQGIMNSHDVNISNHNTYCIKR